MNLFELSATLSLNKDAYVRGLKEARGETESFGGRMVKSLGNTARLAAAQAADAAVSAVKNFTSESLSLSMGFNKSVSQVAATMGMSMDELGEMTAKTSNQYGEFEGNLKDFARWMGSNSAFTASQAAEALNYMALAGYNAQQSMDMLPNVFNLAAAGGMELASASDMITDAQTALGLSFEETARMVDQMAVTSSKSNTSVTQLGEAILTVGAYGKQLKGGTTELNMLLGVLADNSIKGAEGGTHLRNVIRALATPTDQAAKQLKKLGLSAYDSNGNLRGMTEIFADLNTALIGKTGEERNAILSEIFNATDLAAINSLLDTARERWESLEESIENCEGAAEEMGETQLDNLAGDVVKLGSAWDDVKLTIGDTLENVARPFVQTVTEGVGNIGKALKEEGFIGALREAKNLVSNLYDQVVSGLKGSDSTGLQQIGKWLESIKTLGKDVAGAVSDGIKAIGDVASAFQEGGFAAAFETAKSKVEEFWNSVKQDFQMSDNLGLQQIGNAMQTIQDIFQWVIDNQSVVISALGAIFAVLAVEKIAAIAAAFNPVTLAISAIAAGALLIMLNWSSIEGFFKGIWESVSSFATTAWETVKGAWALAGTWFEENIKAPIKAWIDEKTEKVITFFEDTLANITKALADWISADNAQKLITFFENTFAAIKDALATWLRAPATKVISFMFSPKTLGFDPSKGETWSEGVQRTNEQFGIKPADMSQFTEEQLNDPNWDRGLNYVPWDGFVASLHRGETILNRGQAEEWRNGRGGGSVDASAIAAAVSQAIRESMANFGVMIDGQTAGAMVAGSVSRSIAGQVRRGRYN